jgi:hypothetical protein
MFSHTTRDWRRPAARRPVLDVPAFDLLEPRLVLAGDNPVISMGVYYDGHGVTPYGTETELFADGTLNGARADAGPAGPVSPLPLRIDSVAFLPGGRFSPGFAAGFSPFDHVNGAQFSPGASYPVGWFTGFDTGYSSAEFAMYVTPTRSFTLSDMAGSWRAQSLVVSGDDVLPGWSTLYVSGATMDREIHLAGEPTEYDSVGIDISNVGFRLSDGCYGVASSLEHIVVGVDLYESDGDSSLSIMYQPTGSRTAAEIAGGYRVGFLATGALAQSISGLNAAVVSQYLDLRPDGTFTLYELDHEDAGGRTGRWSVSGETVTLVDGARTWTYGVVADNLSLVPRFVSASGTTDVLIGMATYVAAASRSVFSVACNDIFADQVVYYLQGNDQWRSVDLDVKTGGPGITGPTVTWTDPKDGLTYAAAQTGTSLSLYRQELNGTWNRRELGASVPLDQRIETNLAVMTGADQLVRLTGLTSTGDLVEYAQTGGTTYAGEHVWSFTNIAESELRANGWEMPAFAGPTVSYATAWNGLNVAGLDSQGRIWSVWWAPGLSHWEATNLSASLGTQALVGGLAVYLTPWSGINIAGLDAAGEMQVTWWVPQFGGNWSHNNLTAETNGPKFTPESVSSYVSSWGGLNIVGAEQSTGRVMVYWWAPARTNEGWAVTAFEDAVGPGVPSPSRAIQGMAPADNSLNVFGCTSTGDFLRYYWEPGFGGTWEYQGVSDMAVPA